MRIIFFVLTLFFLMLQPNLSWANKQEEAKSPSIYIFMHHEIGQGPANLYVTEEDLERELKILKEEGYKSVTISQAIDLLAANKVKPTDKLVALTFDDGYVSFYQKAYPILKKYGFNATVYIISQQIGKPNHMTWSQLRTIAKGGVEIGSHTETHPYLSKLDKSSLENEVNKSKQTLEGTLNNRLTTFCYPYGDYNDEIIGVVKKAGYKGAVTVRPGISSPVDDIYTLPRVNSYGKMSKETLEYILKLKPGEFDDNLANCFSNIDANPNDDKAYLNRGMAFDAIGKYDEAIADYNKAIKLNPNFTEAYNGRGWVYNNLGQYNKAVADYTKSAELCPTFSYAYNNRGATYIRMNMFAEAIADFNKVIEIDPSFPYLASTYNKMGYANMELGMYDKAIANLNQALDLNNSYAEAYNNRGLVFYKIGQIEKAQLDFAKAIELDQSNPAFYYNSGKLYESIGQLQKAQYLLQKALEIDSENSISG